MKMQPPLRIDIAIVNYFSAEDVARSLDRLGDWPHGVVWVVDNSDDAAQAAELRRAMGERTWVRLIDAGANLGFGRACNLAFERSAAPFFLLLNPDAQAGPGDLLLLAQSLQGDSRLGAVAPRIFWNPARSFVLPAAFAQTPWSAIWQSLASRCRGLARWAAGHSLHAQRRAMARRDPFQVGFLSGAVMMLRRQAVLDAGGLFDPEYFMFFEDSDLCSRLRRSGWRLAIVPGSNAVHEYRHKAFKAAMMTRSREQYYRKRHGWFYRLSRGLSRVDALARPVPVQHWFEVLPRPCRTLEDFDLQTGQAGVIAFSPSMLMMPASFRPQGQAARPFHADEWELLEPADYVALLESGSGPPRWVYFQRI